MTTQISRFQRLLLLALPLVLFVWWMGTLPSQAQEETPVTTESLAAISPSLAQQFSETDGKVSFLVILAEQPDPEGYLARMGLRSASRISKGEAIYRYLSGFARVRQAPLRAWLDKQGVAYRPFYIVNAMEVQGEESLAQALRARTDVGRLASNPEVALSVVDTPEDAAAAANVAAANADINNPDTANPPPDPPYGIRYANAPVVWAMGYRGEGIVLASQDTGVDWTHPALRDQYRGWITATQTVTHPYNWYDAWGTASRGSCDPDPQVPCDDYGHGTHTVGTLVGDDPRSGLITGMAPGAQWIGCRNMTQGNGTPASYMSCFEFFLAPFPQDGDPQTDGDPAKAPHIINNSWYCPPEEGCDFASLRQVVQTVRAAGQLIVVSAGNNGPGCSTVRYPISAYPEVFSVGAHNGAGNITGFSSRGPVTADSSGRLKPEISAAGDGVLSTIIGGGYGNNSGTSMASPHVAGAAALLWSAAPHLIGQLDETEQILIKSATPVLHNGCDDAPNPVSPNNTYGYGRLDAANAVTMALHAGAITATVTGVSRGQQGVTVTLTDQRTGAVRTGQSNNEGEVVFPRVYLGDYVVAAERNGIAATANLAIRPDEQKLVRLSLVTILYFPLIVDQPLLP
ncbi:MAG: S8 family serine peptidase [Caldilineaceae bacterium]|nr:S8 family serine peptidase [Caldilineaceae bacterium]